MEKCVISCDRIMEEHCSNMRNLYECVKESEDLSDLRKMYSYLRECCSDFQSDKGMHWLYDYAKENLSDAERLFNDKYLVDTSFNLDIDNPLSINKDSNELEILDYLVYCTRVLLIDNLADFYKVNRNNKVWNLYLVNYCELASEKIKFICSNLGIKCDVLKIYPGFLKDSDLLGGIGHHYLNIIDFGSNKYIVDATYSQFFNMQVSNIGRLGLINYPLTSAGYFMMIDDFRKNVALEILKSGYIKLNNDIFKAYMDGFALSFRNGLYYSSTNDYSYTTCYSTNDYINFLTGYDNQINHEGIEVLGFQKKINLD